jgi:hypothetical protein
MISARAALVLLALAIVGCDQPAAPAAAAPGPAAVVEEFLAGYDGNFRAANSALLSSSLGAAFISAVAIEDQSRVAVKASEFPNDKPQLLEGEIFSGLYEGFTGWSITSEDTRNHQAAVEVAFTNSHYGVGWIDRVDLVEEDGWKIDDVRYLDKKTGALGLRDVLRGFEEAAAQDPLLNNPPQS